MGGFESVSINYKLLGFYWNKANCPFEPWVISPVGIVFLSSHKLFAELLTLHHSLPGDRNDYAGKPWVGTSKDSTIAQMSIASAKDDPLLRRGSHGIINRILQVEVRTSIQWVSDWWYHNHPLFLPLLPPCLLRAWRGGIVFIRPKLGFEGIGAISHKTLVLFISLPSPAEGPVRKLGDACVLARGNFAFKGSLARPASRRRSKTHLEERRNPGQPLEPAWVFISTGPCAHVEADINIVGRRQGQAVLPFL